MGDNQENPNLDMALISWEVTFKKNPFFPHMSEELIVISSNLTWLLVLHIKIRSRIIKTY